MNISGKGGRNGPVQKPGALTVIDIGPGIHMGRIHPHQLFFLDHPANLALRIIEVTEGAGLGRAGHHAGGFVTAF